MRKLGTSLDRKIGTVLRYEEVPLDGVNIPIPYKLLLLDRRQHGFAWNRGDNHGAQWPAAIHTMQYTTCESPNQQALVV